MISTNDIVAISIGFLTFLVLTGYIFRHIRSYFRARTMERKAIEMYLSHSGSKDEQEQQQKEALEESDDVESGNLESEKSVSSFYFETPTTHHYNKASTTTQETTRDRHY